MTTTCSRGRSIHFAVMPSGVEHGFVKNTGVDVCVAYRGDAGRR